MVLGAGQIALSTVLVIWAGLLLRNDVQMRSLALHGSVGGVRIAALALPSNKYRAPEQRRAFFDNVTARLRHVHGVRFDDPGDALPLAGNAYFAVFFAMGDGPPSVQLPDRQRFIQWHADTNAVTLANEVNHAVKSFDRGIHYWHMGLDASRATFLVFVAYAAVGLLLVYAGFRGEALGRAILAAAAGMVIGLGLAHATTWLLTGYLWGVSVTDPAVFLVSAMSVAAIAVASSSFNRWR